MSRAGRLSRTALVALCIAETELGEPPCAAAADAVPAGRSEPAASPSLDDVRVQYNAALYHGLLQLRANKQAGEEHLVGDNTDPSGMYWTKPSNLGVDLVSAMVAAGTGLATESETSSHVKAVLEALGGLPTHHGVFPEFLQIEAGIRPEITRDRIRYSAIDSAWLTLALSLVLTRYESTDRELAQKAGALLDRQDYAFFVGPDGLLGGGVVLDARTRQVVDNFGFSYGERNSEARLLVLALVSMGKLPASAWDNMHYAWLLKEGVPLARGRRWSAFVELSGALFFDEEGLAPRSLGQSHGNYVRATRNVARRLGHRVWGYGPSGNAIGGYAEHGLDDPAVVAPYAAGLLAASGERSAVSNLDAVLRLLPSDGRPLPDGLDPRTGQVVSPVARTFDQSLLFLALNANTLRGLVQKTRWYAAAASKLRDLDRTCSPPAQVPLATPASACPSCRGSISESGRESAVAVVADPAWHAAPSGFAAEPLGASATALLDGAELDAALERARAALHAVGQTAQAHQTTAGGQIDLAVRQAEVESDAVTRAWLELAPELTLSLRREFTFEETVAAAPTWRAQLDAKLTLSAFELRGLGVAQRSQSLAATLPAAAGQEVQLQALAAQLELYVRERELAAMREQRASFARVLAGLDARSLPGSEAEAPLLAARLSALDQAIADAESTRQQAGARLTAWTGTAFADSGLDLRLQLEDVLGLIRRETRGVTAVAEQRAQADVELQASQLAAEATRAWYFPALRVGVFAAAAKGQAPGGTAPDWALDRVIGEFSAAFTWLPGAPFASRARAAALERSEWQLAEIRRARAESIEVAGARLAARAAEASWDGAATARESYADHVERFARGELEAQALIGATSTLCEQSAAAERVFGEALDAQLLLARQAPAEPPTPTAPVSPPGGPGRYRWLPHDANLAQRAALPRAGRLRAAQAEALRAQAQAQAVRASSLQIGLEGGIFYPFQVQSEPVVGGSVGSGVPAGPAAFGPERTLDVTAFGRGSLDVTFNARQALAARAEAELRAAESTLARKALAGEQAKARLALAYAHAGLRLASERVEFATGRRAAIERMRAQGYIDDDTLALQAELAEGESRRDWQRARSRLLETQIRVNGLLGRPGSGQLEIEETPEELQRWLVDTYYPAEGLLGYASELKLTIAELEARWTEACYQALRRPPSTFSLTLQATQSLLGGGYALGLGLGFQLDPRTRPADTVDAAERAGDRRGQLAVAGRALETERRLARAALDSTRRAQQVESARRERLREILDDLLRSQAADLDRHESSKLRTRDAVQERVLEAERRLLERGYELDLARLRWLELGGTDSEIVALPAVAPAASLQSALSQLVEGDPEVTRADLAARAVEQAGVRPPLLSGLHPLGPVLGGAYSVQVSAQPVRVRSQDVQGDLGIGVSYGLDEGLAFLSTGRREEALRLAREGVRKSARDQAVEKIGELWLAHELHGLLARREAVAQQGLENVGVPRYSAAHIDSAALAATEAEHAQLLVDRERAANAEQAQRSTLQAQGAVLGEGAWSEFASCVVPELGAQPAVRREPRSEPLFRAAERRSSAAGMDTLLAALGVVGPTTFFLELVPQAQTDDLRQDTGWRRRLAGVASLIVPVSVRAIADGVAASSLSARRDSESQALERAFVVAGSELDPRIGAALATWQAAREHSAAASRAVLELSRLRAAGSVRITPESLALAQADAFDAERAELTARAPLLVLCTEQQALRRHAGPAAPAR